MPLDIPSFDTNKATIEKSVSEFENNKSVEKQINEIHNILWNKVIKEWKENKYPKWIEVIFLENNVFLVIDKNKNYPKIFVDKNWDVLLSIIARERQISIKNDRFGNPWKAMIKAWFVFWENLQLNKIIWYKNWTLVIDWKVDTNSKEYYYAWKKILKASWDIFVNSILQSNNKTKFVHNSFDALLDTGSINKEILEKINNKRLLTQEDYEYWLNYLEKQDRESVDRAIEDIKNRVK